MIVARFRPEHLQRLQLQPAQRWAATQQTPDHGNALALGGPAFTVFDATGRDLMACIGAYEYHPQRAEGWAVLAPHAGALLRPMTRAIRAWLIDINPYRRLECTVATNFEAGLRWAKMLGFEQEGGARKAYLPDGQDAITFVFFKGG